MMQRMISAAVLAVTSATFGGTIQCLPQQTAKLTADDGAERDSFGNSVATSGGVTVIGAYFKDNNTGSAYVYEQQIDDTWEQVAKLTLDDGHWNDLFGRSVAISGGVAVIGANGVDNGVDGFGSAYVYEQQGDGTWQQTATLTANDGNEFGWSVAIDAGVAVIGDYRGDGNVSNSGTAYVFEQQEDGTWQQIAKLMADDGASGYWFGYSVALDAGVAVIGGISGSVYVYEQQGDGTWQQTATLTTADGGSNDYFGGSVALDAGVAVIGASGNDDNGSNSGSAYVFEQQVDGTWAQTATLTADDGAEGDSFGNSVATSGGMAVIGAIGDDDNGNESGSVYVYEQQADGGWNPNALIDCNENGICDFDEIAAVPIKDTDENGTLDECEVGACCIGTAVVCTISMESDCLQFGGQWQGLETTCEEVDCPTSCLGDLTGSGDVVIHDLLILLEHWGPCP
jgi:hypothetical protein